MNIRRALTYPFDDEQWRNKLGVLLLLSLIPGFNLIMWMGYAITIAHNVIRGSARPLPEWADWMDIVVRGLMGLIASLVYFLPLLLVILCAALLNTLSGVVWLCVVPFGVIYGVAALALLAVGHVRYARSDGYNDYYAFRRRLNELRATPAAYLRLALLQLGLFGLSVLLAILSSPTLLGPFIAFGAAAIISGYWIGMLARSARRR